MISKKTKYGLKALIYLANNPPDQVVLIADLAQQENIPKKFLEAILLELKNNGLLQSRKGKGGGYSLGRRPQEITLGQVVRILNGPLAPVSCVSQSAYKRCDECKDEKNCGIRLVMKEVRDAMSEILDRTTLTDVICKMQESNRAPNFAI